ncbi:DUF3021 domain-containing protein [Facklamia languida]|uniref:Uncharacterized protein n=1 Tax=Facklamia languida CCUG 37842 TaxID=883113 RepID=H3NHP3_9LACT|nr:DUF3021 domain-containing protein [Facklamia languida]EHR37949.1 hypothetical protein HMPREF9708_00578 [Facklamia languida CCUG 37842]
MFKRVGSLIQYGLLATLLVFGFVNHWGVPQIYTYLSVIVLGIVLGLLFLIYNLKSMTFSQKLAMHIGFSALAILVVAIFNGWLTVNWDRVFTAILIICGLVLLIYFGYQYYMNSRSKAQEDPVNTVDTLDHPNDYTQEGDFDLATGQVVGSSQDSLQDSLNTDLEQAAESERVTPGDHDPFDQDLEGKEKATTLDDPIDMGSAEANEPAASERMVSGASDVFDRQIVDQPEAVVADRDPADLQASEAKAPEADKERGVLIVEAPLEAEDSVDQ